MAEETSLTLVSLKYGEDHWGGTSGGLSEDSIVKVKTAEGTEEVKLKDYTSSRSITQKVEKKIEGEEQTRADALNTLLAHLRSDSASDAERGSLFLVQHAKDSERSNDYDIYVLMGDSPDNYKLQRIGTSIEYTGGSTVIDAKGDGIKVEKTDDTYKISLDDHMSKIYEYIDFAEPN